MTGSKLFAPESAPIFLRALLLGMCLLIGLASPAGAQTLPVFPNQVGVGAFPNEEYIDLYYPLGQPITPLVVFPAATGGTAPLTYSLDGGAASLGFAFDPNTRELSGTPTLAGAGSTGVDGFELTYAVDDSAREFDTILVYITVCENGGTPSGATTCTAPLLTPITIPLITIPSTYTAGEEITPLVLPSATGGTGSSPVILYTLLNVPDGLTFNASTRILSGTPTTAGETNLTYRARDAAECSGNCFDSADGQQSLDFMISVNPGALTLLEVDDQAYPKDVEITNLVLPMAMRVGGTAGTALTYTLTGPEDSDLPAGLIFDPDTRTLSGTPTAAMATELTYTATDASGNTATRMFTVAVTVLALPPVTTPRDYQSYTAGVPITDLILPEAFMSQVELTTLTYTLFGPDGTTATPNLPDGLSFNAMTRTLSGMPTTAGVTELAYTVTNSGVTDTSSPQRQQVQQFTITVELAGQALTLASLPDQRFALGVEVAYSLPTAIGGTAPRTYTLLPPNVEASTCEVAPGTVENDAALAMCDIAPGMNFNRDNFRLRGLPTTEGTYQAIYTVTDANGDSVSREFTITVAPPAPDPAPIPIPIPVPVLPDDDPLQLFNAEGFLTEDLTVVVSETRKVTIEGGSSPFFVRRDLSGTTRSTIVDGRKLRITGVSAGQTRLRIRDIRGAFTFLPVRVKALPPVLNPEADDGTGTEAVFRGGASSDGGDTYFKDGVFSVGEALDILLVTTPRTADVGEQANVVIAARMASAPEEVWLLTQSGLVAYNGETLVPFKENLALEANNFMDLTPEPITLSSAEVGNWELFVGYQLANGELFYHPVPLRIEVVE